MNAELQRGEDRPQETKTQKGYKYSDSPRWSLLIKYDILGVVTKNDVFSVLYSIGKHYGEELTITSFSKKGRVGRMTLEHFVSRQEQRSRGQAVIPVDMQLSMAALLGGCANRVNRVNLYTARFQTKIVAYAELERSLAFTDALALYAQAHTSLEQQVETVLNRLKASVKTIAVVQIGPPNMWGGENYRDREVYLVEGRADIERLGKMGIRNTISIDGKNLAESTITYLNSSGQVYTAMFDGDRNGRQLMAMIRSRVRVTYEVEVPKDAKVQSMSFTALRTCLNNRILR
jgi:DNA primase